MCHAGTENKINLLNRLIANPLFTIWISILSFRIHRNAFGLMGSTAIVAMVECDGPAESSKPLQAPRKSNVGSLPRSDFDKSRHFISFHAISKFSGDCGESGRFAGYCLQSWCRQPPNLSNISKSTGVQGRSEQQEQEQK